MNVIALIAAQLQRIPQRRRAALYRFVLVVLVVLIVLGRVSKGDAQTIADAVAGILGVAASSLAAANTPRPKS